MLIEFVIAFRNPSGGAGEATVEAHFDESRVRVIPWGARALTHAEWDEKRVRISELVHGDWPSIYPDIPTYPGNPPLLVEQEYAFCALHVLTPDSARVMELARNPSAIADQYPSHCVPAGRGQTLRLLHALSTPEEEKAAEELFGEGRLQRLDVLAPSSGGRQVDFSVYFAPPHAPLERDLSPAASALNASLWEIR